MADLIEVKIRLKIFTWAENGRWLASCPYLNVVSHGDLEEKAIQNLKEEVRFLVEVGMNAGNLAEIIRQRVPTTEPQEEFVSVERINFGKWMNFKMPQEAILQMTHAAAR